MWRFLVVGAVLVSGVSVGGYEAYQSRPSGDVRRILTAALDPTATNADVKAYERDARLAIRTRRDREIDQQFENMVSIAEENCDSANFAFQTALQTAQLAQGWVKEYQDRGEKAPKDAMKLMDDDGDDEQRAYAAFADCEAKVAKDQREVPKMLAALRASLSLTPK